MHLQTAELGALEHFWAKIKFLHYHLGKSNQAADDLSQFPLARPHRAMDVEAEAIEVPALAGGIHKNRPQVNLIHVLEEYNWVEI